MKWDVDVLTTCAVPYVLGKWTKGRRVAVVRVATVRAEGGRMGASRKGFGQSAGAVERVQEEGASSRILP